MKLNLVALKSSLADSVADLADMPIERLWIQGGEVNVVWDYQGNSQHAVFKCNQFQLLTVKDS